MEREFICEKCRFCAETGSQSHFGFIEHMECRIDPPVPDKNGEGIWPKVPPNGWCGQFLPREE